MQDCWKGDFEDFGDCAAKEIPNQLNKCNFNWQTEFTHLPFQWINPKSFGKCFLSIYICKSKKEEWNTSAPLKQDLKALILALKDSAEAFASISIYCNYVGE